MNFDKFLVFLKKNGPVFPAGHLGIRDIITHRYEARDDLVNGFPGCRFSDGMKLRHDLVQVGNRYLRSIHKLERAPANCRRVGVYSSNSSANLKKRHIIHSFKEFGGPGYRPFPMITSYYADIHPLLSRRTIIERVLCER